MFSGKVLHSSNKKLALNLPHVHILGTHHCDRERYDTFKRRGDSQNVLCRRYYEERLVYFFSNKI